MGCASQAGKLLLATLLLLAPSALAHGGFDEGRALADGSVHLRVLGAPVLAAGGPLRLEVATDLALPIDARLVPPGSSAGQWFQLHDDGAVLARDVTFDREGDWRIDLRAGADVASFEVRVWPAGPSFTEPASGATERGVIVVGSDEPIRIRVLDAAHRPLAPPTDAIALIRGPDGASREPLHARDGLLELRRDWSERGDFDIEVLSEQARLSPGARPPIGLLVVAPEDAPVYGIPARETPLGVPLAIGALLVAVALARGLTRERP